VADAGFEVDGLRELISDLKAFDSSLGRAVSKGFRDAMNQNLLPTAQANMGGQPVPKQAAMITAYGQQKEAGLVLRYARFPWAAGAEWGSKQYRQFRPWVGNAWTGASRFPGYMIGAAFTTHLPTLEKKIVDAVKDAVLRKVGM